MVQAITFDRREGHHTPEVPSRASVPPAALPPPPSPPPLSRSPGGDRWEGQIKCGSFLVPVFRLPPPGCPAPTARAIGTPHQLNARSSAPISLSTSIRTRGSDSVAESACKRGVTSAAKQRRSCRRRTRTTSCSDGAAHAGRVRSDRERLGQRTRPFSDRKPSESTAASRQQRDRSSVRRPSNSRATFSRKSKAATVAGWPPMYARSSCCISWSDACHDSPDQCIDPRIAHLRQCGENCCASKSFKPRSGGYLKELPRSPEGIIVFRWK